MKIDYNREECETEYKVEMVHCQRVKISVKIYNCLFINHSK